MSEITFKTKEEHDKFLSTVQQEIGAFFTTLILLNQRLQTADDLVLRQEAENATLRDRLESITSRCQRAEAGLLELQKSSDDPKINRDLNRRKAKTKG